MRSISLIILLALFGQTTLDGLVAWASEGSIELKSEDPILDARGETKFLFARVSQIEKAKTGDKLPLRLTAKIQNTRKKTELKAKMQSTSSKLIAEVATKVADKKTLVASAVQKTDKAHLEAKEEAKQLPLPEQKHETKQSATNQTDQLKLTDVYAGQLQLVAEHQFASDPSLNIRLNQGERGFTVIRFEKSANGNLRMHPPAVFFAGRDLPGSQMKEQQRRFDDPYADRRQQSLVDNGLKNLSNWFGWSFKTNNTAVGSEHLNYVYVPLGTIASHNRLGHYYLQNVISTNTKIIDDKSLAQDEVASVQTNDTASPTRYYEFATHFELTGAGKAHVKIARVQYSEDRSILRSQIFEGDLTTNEASSVQADISSYTKKSWDQISTEFHL